MVKKIVQRDPEIRYQVSLEEIPEEAERRIDRIFDILFEIILQNS